MMVWMLIVAAVAFLLWPVPQPPANPFVRPTDDKPAAAQTPSFMDAVAALQVVRSRLACTSKLDEAQQKALDSLTLALSAGSEK